MDNAGRGIDQAATMSALDFGRLSRFIYDTCGIKMPEVKRSCWRRASRRGAFIFMGHSETLSGLNVPLVSVYPTVYRRLR
jgi:hypothetical protein